MSDLARRHPCRVTITIDGWREDIIEAALKSIANSVSFDSPSGCGEAIVTVDTVAKFPPYPTGKMNLAVNWSYKVEKQERG